MLNTFYNFIEKILLNHEPLITQLQELRELIKNSLMLEEFRLKCVEQVLDSMDRWTDQDTAWNAPHLFYHEQLKYSVRIIFWPPFHENNPHKHKTWSATGIFHNFLNINTYELLDNPTRLKREKTIAASAFEAGYLIPGCIHNISNPTHELSASIHIFNNIDISNPEDNAVWFPAPRKFNLSSGLMERALSTCLMVASDIKNINAWNIINRIYEKSPVALKLMAIQAMYKFDRLHARKCFASLEVNL